MHIACRYIVLILVEYFYDDIKTYQHDDMRNENGLFYFIWFYYKVQYLIRRRKLKITTGEYQETKKKKD